MAVMARGPLCCKNVDVSVRTYVSGWFPLTIASVFPLKLLTCDQSMDVSKVSVWTEEFHSEDSLRPWIWSYDPDACGCSSTSWHSWPPCWKQCGRRKQRGPGARKKSKCLGPNSKKVPWWRWLRSRKKRTHLYTVKPSKQVMEDDHVTVNGQQRQETGDGNQEEDDTCCLQASTATDDEEETQTGNGQRCKCNYWKKKKNTEENRGTLGRRTSGCVIDKHENKNTHLHSLSIWR